jgi:hypothetical protein
MLINKNCIGAISFSYVRRAGKYYDEKIDLLDFDGYTCLQPPEYKEVFFSAICVWVDAWVGLSLASERFDVFYSYSAFKTLSFVKPVSGDYKCSNSKSVVPSDRRPKQNGDFLQNGSNDFD